MTEGSQPPARSTRRLLVAAGVVALMVLGWFGVRPAPATEPLARAEQVVLVSVPGVRWQDLDAVDTPHLDALIGDSALLSVRAIGSSTSLLEGYASWGAGNRLEPSGGEQRFEVVDGCAAGMAAALADAADDELNGAVPGALGDVLRGAGLTTAVFGGVEAVAVLMDGSGCVDRFDTGAAPVFDADVTLVEWRGLEVGGPAAERVEAVLALDAAVASWAIPADAAVGLVAAMAVDDGAEVTVVAWRGSEVGAAPEALQSPSTRRAGYLTLNDLAPTVLSVVGLASPESMNGTPAVSAGAVASTSERVRELADLADRVAFRDRAITPVVACIAIGVALCIVLWWRGRIRHARAVGATTVALPTVAFLSGATDYHLLPLWVYVVVAVVAASVLAMAAAAGAAAGTMSFTTVDILAGVLWVVLVVDLVTGGHLQINTPLGYTPTVAGRFQGLGNVAFGLLAVAGVATACAVHEVGERRGRSVAWWASGWLVAVGALTAVVVAAPRFGSDMGGTLAVVPSIAVAFAVATGRRIGWRRIAVMAVATVGSVVALGMLDHARPASEQTHLGRFVGRLLDGEAGLILRRKMQGNIDLFTASVFPVLGVLVVALGALYAWRRRNDLAVLLRDRRAVRAFLAGFGTVAILGLALNDSGIAVPAVMLAVAVPRVLATMVPVPERVAR